MTQIFLSEHILVLGSTLGSRVVSIFLLEDLEASDLLDNIPKYPFHITYGRDPRDEVLTVTGSANARLPAYKPGNTIKEGPCRLCMSH